jgi:hypothetical protein
VNFEEFVFSTAHPRSSSGALLLFCPSTPTTDPGLGSPLRLQQPRPRRPPAEQHQQHPIARGRGITGASPPHRAQPTPGPAESICSASSIPRNSRRVGTAIDCDFRPDSSPSPMRLSWNSSPPNATATEPQFPPHNALLALARCHQNPAMPQRGVPLWLRSRCRLIGRFLWTQPSGS